MWWKLILLSFYLIILILLSRVFELFTYYQTGQFSTRLINPLSLTVQNLRAILESRGVSHRNVLEKQDLTQLVASSGDLTSGELEEALMGEDDVHVEDFQCGDHFLEKTDDNKDSVWVVQVVKSGFINKNGNSRKTKIKMAESWDGGGGVDMLAWRHLAKKLSKFGIQCGVFRCDNDEKFCDKKRWHSSRIILSTPEGSCIKDRVVMEAMEGSLSKKNGGKVMDWVGGRLSDKVEKVGDFDEFENKWLRFHYGDFGGFGGVKDGGNLKKKRNERREERLKNGGRGKEEKWLDSGSSSTVCGERIRALIISNLTTAPLFFSVMAAKFSGRLRLAMINTKDTNYRKYISKLASKNSTLSHLHQRLKNSNSNYVIITPHRVKSFGGRKGESLNYRSLFSLFRSLHPEMNDIFKFSIIISSILCTFNLFRPSFLHQSLSTLKTTTILLLVWLATTNSTILQPITNLLLSLLPFFSLTDYASLLRDDIFFYTSTSSGRIIIITTTIIFLILLNVYHLKQPQLNTTEDTTTTTNTQHSSLQQSPTTTYNNLLNNIFENICGSLFHTTTHQQQQLDLDDDYDMIIQRLAVPDLWLRPLISSQYIHDLPTWVYERVGGDDDGDFVGDNNGVLGAEDSGSFGEDGLVEIAQLQRSCHKRNNIDNGNNNENDIFSRRLDDAYNCNFDDGDRDVSDGGCGSVRSGVVSCGSSGCGTARRTEENPGDYRHDNTQQQQHKLTTKSAFTSFINRFKRNKYRHLSNNKKTPKITNQPPSTTTTPPNIIFSTECSICLDTYVTGDVLCGLPCYHGYHQRCIVGWLSRDNHCCPICRWPSYKSKVVK